VGGAGGVSADMDEVYGSIDSARERQVLTLVARGLNNTEIAEAMGLSPLTAKTHVSRIMGKLAARDRAQLVIAAYESGLVSAGE
jgi:DNA-binding NarL/FixJ family response regulator